MVGLALRGGYGVAIYVWPLERYWMLAGLSSEVRSWNSISTDMHHSELFHVSGCLGFLDMRENEAHSVEFRQCWLLGNAIRHVQTLSKTFSGTLKVISWICMIRHDSAWYVWGPQTKNKSLESFLYELFCCQVTNTIMWIIPLLFLRNNLGTEKVFQ